MSSISTAWKIMPQDLESKNNWYFLRNSAKPCALTLNICIDGPRLQIWRQVVTRNDITLHQFHELIQIAMGWRSEHVVYEFEVHNLIFTETSEEDDNVGRLNLPIDSTRVTLSQIVESARTSFQYTYDLGQEWVHTISLVSIDELDDTKMYPYCTDGNLACPPENSGGSEGYDTFLEELEVGHEKSEGWREWLVECDYPDFDPSRFEIEKVNRALAIHFNSIN